MTSTFASDDLEVLRNRTFDEIAVGDRASIERTLTAADIHVAARRSAQHVALSAGSTQKITSAQAEGVAAPPTRDV